MLGAFLLVVTGYRGCLFLHCPPHYVFDSASALFFLLGEEGVYFFG